MYECNKIYVNLLCKTTACLRFGKTREKNFGKFHKFLRKYWTI